MAHEDKWGTLRLGDYTQRIDGLGKKQWRLANMNIPEGEMSNVGVCMYLGNYWFSKV